MTLNVEIDAVSCAKCSNASHRSHAQSTIGEPSMTASKSCELIRRFPPFLVFSFYVEVTVLG
jgi:hypothetical protein